MEWRNGKRNGGMAEHTEYSNTEYTEYSKPRKILNILKRGMRGKSLKRGYKKKTFARVWSG